MFKNDNWKHYSMQDDMNWPWTLRLRRWFWSHVANVAWDRWPKVRKFACYQLPGVVKLEIRQ
jgi:hypothetical protein